MKVKEFYNIVLGLTDDQVEQLYEMSARMGIAIPDLIEKVINLLMDASIGADLMKEMYADLKPTFLSYLMGLSQGDFREVIDCLSFLKQKQDEADEVDVLLKQVEDHAIDEAALMELKRICGSYGIDVEEENMGAVKACLEEEKRNIRADMYIPDLGFEPDNLYSAVDVVQTAFDGYGQTCMREDADMTEELRKVLTWIEENEDRFYPKD